MPHTAPRIDLAPRRAHAPRAALTRTALTRTALTRTALTLTALTLSLLALSLTRAQGARASCLLTMESAAPLAQGDAAAQAGGFGGSEGGGASLIGRLGLNADRELHLRLGLCQREVPRAPTATNAAPAPLSLWGKTLEFGLKQRLLSEDTTGGLSIALSLSATALAASDGEERGVELSRVGFTPALLLSYPFDIAEGREGFVSLTLGSSLTFDDLNLTPSALSALPLAALTVGVDILPELRALGAVSAQADGVYGGAAAAYRF